METCFEEDDVNYCVAEAMGWINDDDEFDADAFVDSITTSVYALYDEGKLTDDQVEGITEAVDTCVTAEAAEAFDIEGMGECILEACRSAGSDESGSDESGSDESGSDEFGSEESGSDESGSDESSSDESGSDEFDSNESGSDESGSYESGSDESGSDESGSFESGSDESGFDEFGSD